MAKGMRGDPLDLFQTRLSCVALHRAPQVRSVDLSPLRGRKKPLRLQPPLHPLLEALDQSVPDEDDAVFCTFPLADIDTAAVEIHVIRPKRHNFSRTQSS